MSLFIVDQEKCRKDGICVKVCPIGIIEQKDKNSFPKPTDDAESACVVCGHCVAACPHGALSHRAMAPGECMPIRKDMQPNVVQVEQFLRSRRSMRLYQDKPVDRRILTGLVDIARYAPSGINSQPVEWLIIHDQSEVQRCGGMVIDWMRAMIKDNPQLAASLRMENTVAKWERGIDVICRKAPHIFVTHAHKDNPLAQSSCTIALTYLELAAFASGLGACWAGYFDVAARFWPPLRKEMGLPDGHVSYGAMMVGYPAMTYHRIPRRNEARITWR
jgi:nitroreductase/NAD-dependent dihydropyrimidine dehydrogenase PreA subunit